MLARVVFTCLLMMGVLAQAKKPTSSKKTDSAKKFTVDEKKPASHGYELCQALKSWHFVGPAFKYRKSIRLMSDRLLNIRSMGLLVHPIEGGESWNLTLKFILKGDEKHHGEGFGIWISNKEMFSDLFEHLTKSKTKEHAFGYGGMFTGVGIGVLHNKSGATSDSYYVSRTYDGIVSRSGFIFNSQVCKKLITFDEQNTILLKYRWGTLSFYVVQHGVESLCGTYTFRLANFHLMLTSSSQVDHSMSIEVSSLQLETTVPNRLEILPEDPGMYNKDFFRLQGVNFMKHFHDYRDFEEKKYSLYSKKFKSLLETTNKTKILESLYKRESTSLNTIGKTLQTISLMASDLRTMLSYLDSNEDSSKKSLQTNIEQVMNWVTSMNNGYDQLENEIDLLTKKVSAFQFDAYLSTVREKLNPVALSLLDFEYKSADVIDKSAQVLEFVSKLDKFTRDLKDKSVSFPDNIRRKVAESSGGEVETSYYVTPLIFIGGILAVLGWLFFKARRIHKKTHIL